MIALAAVATALAAAVAFLLIEVRRESLRVDHLGERIERSSAASSTT